MGLSLALASIVSGGEDRYQFRGAREGGWRRVDGSEQLVFGDGARWKLC